MTLDLAHLADWLAAFAWPLGRVLGLVLVAPVLGAVVIPLRIRAGLAALLTFVLAPLATNAPAIAPLSLPGFALLIEQVALGAAIGFALKLAFEAVAFGGQLIAMSMGLSYADVVDPQSHVSMPVLSQLYMTLATLIFLALNGHLALIEVLADSFRVLPSDAFGLDRDALHLLVTAGAHVFAGALRVALPAMGALLIVNLGFGVMSRAAPTMNLQSVGFPITLTLGILVVWLSLRGLPTAFAGISEGAFGLVRDVLGAGP